MIYTSYFANAEKALKTVPDLTFFSIAGKSPDWFRPELVKYGKLAPKYSWWAEWKTKFARRTECPESKEWYAEKYSETVLSGLDPEKVKNELELASKGENACLLCWEAPDKFCHRRLVAEWLADAGIPCEELRLA